MNEGEAPLVRTDAPASGSGDAAGPRLHRRRLIGAGAASAAGAVAMGAAALPLTQAAPATPGPGAPPATDSGPRGYVTFSPFQAAIVEAAAERLIPGDALGPGARDAGVVFFIDRQLANAERGYRGPVYRQGPFVSGEATQGDQSMLPVRERFRLGILALDAEAQARFGAGFAALPGERQDAILADLERGRPERFATASLAAPPAEGSLPADAPQAVSAKAFFELLLAYVQAGFFADPAYGGNRDMAGWKLIGFPGAQMGYAQWIERYGEPFTGPYQSLADVQGFAHHEERS